MENLKMALREISERAYDVTTNSKSEQSIQQTQRNNTKTAIINALCEDLREYFADEEVTRVYRVKKGIALEVANASIADKVTGDLGSGAITIVIDCAIQNLDTDAAFDADEYTAETATKAEAKAEAERKKSAKIARDKAEREAKAKAKAEAIKKREGEG